MHSLQLRSLISGDLHWSMDALSRWHACSAVQDCRECKKNCWFFMAPWCSVYSYCRCQRHEVMCVIRWSSVHHAAARARLWQDVKPAACDCVSLLTPHRQEDFDIATLHAGCRLLCTSLAHVRSWLVSYRAKNSFHEYIVVLKCFPLIRHLGWSELQAQVL